MQASQAAQGNDSLQFSFLPLAIAGIAGAILGVVVIIPLRKQMIELDRLRFPSGVATATIIRAGSTGLDKAILLGVGVLISVIWKLLLESGWLNSPAMVANWGFGIQSEELHFGFGIIPDYCAPVVYLSLMNMAAGMLAGRGGIPFFLGGAIAWWVISPATVGLGWAPATEQGIALIGGQMLRPIGIGVIIGGALMGVVMSIPAIRAAFATLASATKTAGVGGRRSDEMSMWTIAWGTGAAILLFFLASRMTEGVTTGQAIISAIVGTLWLGLAALIVAQATGLTDISPMSGMALISVTLMMFLLNKNVAAAMVVGVAVCVAIGQGADMMQDLKTGFMIGARPIKQQIVQFATTWIGAIIALVVVYILWAGGEGDQNGFGPGTALPAPQGGALMGILEAVSQGDVPIGKYVAGSAIGAVLGAAPLSGMGVLVGLAMYLPFSITLGYGLGCFTQMIVQRIKGSTFCEEKLVPLAAGLIVGEALTGVILTAIKIYSNK